MPKFEPVVVDCGDFKIKFKVNRKSKKDLLKLPLALQPVDKKSLEQRAYYIPLGTTLPLPIGDILGKYIAHADIKSLGILSHHYLSKTVSSDLILPFLPSLSKTAIEELTFLYIYNKEFFNHLRDRLKNTRVKTLNILYCKLTVKDLSFLRYILIRNPYHPIIDLDLSFNLLGDNSIKLLASYLKDSKLKKLALAGNRFGDKGVEHLMSSLNILSLEKLDLRYNEIGWEGATLLAPYLKKPSLKSFLIGFNTLEKGIEALAAYLKHSTIEVLGLNKVEMEKEGLSALSEAMPSSLKEIDIDFNGLLDSEDVEAFLEKLSETAVEKLSLFGCDISNRGIKTLLELVNTKKLKFLDLCLNPRVSEDMKMLLIECLMNPLLDDSELKISLEIGLPLTLNKEQENIKAARKKQLEEIRNSLEDIAINKQVMPIQPDNNQMFISNEKKEIANKIAKKENGNPLCRLEAKEPNSCVDNQSKALEYVDKPKALMEKSNFKNTIQGRPIGLQIPPLKRETSSTIEPSPYIRRSIRYSFFYNLIRDKDKLAKPLPLSNSPN